MSIPTCEDVKKTLSFGTGFTQMFLQLKDLSVNADAMTIGFVTSHFFSFFFFCPEEQGLASGAVLMGSVWQCPSWCCLLVLSAGRLACLWRPWMQGTYPKEQQRTEQLCTWQIHLLISLDPGRVYFTLIQCSVSTFCWGIDPVSKIVFLGLEGNQDEHRTT